LFEFSHVKMGDCILERIMFVCHGNICRSPLAQFVMLDLVKKAGLENKFLIESAATSREELGNPVYPPMKRTMLSKNLPFFEHYSTLLSKDDYDKYDLFVLMDKNNLRNIKMYFPNDVENKIHLLMEYTGEARDVADPWYSGDFEQTYNDVVLGCKALLKYIIEN